MGILIVGRLIIVSNRLPVKVVKGLEIQPSVGGLATGLLSIHKIAYG